MLRVRIQYYLSKEGINYFPKWVEEVTENARLQDGFVAIHQAQETPDLVLYLFFETEETLSAWIETEEHDRIASRIERHFVHPLEVEVDETPHVIIPSYN